MNDKVEIKKTSEQTDEKRSAAAGLAGLWRQLFLVSIGAAAMAQEEAEKLVSKLVEQGELAEQEGKRMVDQMVNKQKKGIRQGKEKVDDVVEDTLHKLNIPSRDELRALEMRMAELSAKLDKLSSSSSQE